MNPGLRQALQRVSALFRRNPMDSDLDAEIEVHIEEATEDNIRAGMSPEEARRQALIRFGGVSQAKELQRETRSLPALEVLVQDLKFTLRTLRRDRAFATVVVLVLALGIGANVAVFGIVNAILLRPLPFQEPGQLVWFAANEGKGGLSSQTYTVAAFEEFRKHNRSFQDVTSYQTFFNSIHYKLTGQGEPLTVVGVQVAENFFPMLGVEPALGRVFTPDECRKGGRAAILLSHGFWQRQFGGDPSIIGRSVTIQGTPVDIPGPFTVVGVLPQSFDFGAVFSPGMQVDFYTPAIMDFWRTWGNTLAITGRLKPGVSASQAHEEAKILFPQLRAAKQGWFCDYKSKLSSLSDHVSGKLRRTLYVLWAAVGLILLIVCINVSNLLLARTMSRGKEFAMRTALGAGRGRLVRQLLTESLVLTGAGAAIGLVLAWGLTAYMARQTQINLPLLSTLQLDFTMVGWTILVAVGGGLIFGLAPALKISGQANLQDVLKDSGPGMSQGKSQERLRSTLVVSEVALACVLLVGAGLLLRSFVRLLDVDLGFEPAHVLAMKVELNDGGETKRRGPVVQEILRQVRELPGVEAAGMSDMLPLDRNRSWGLVSKENLNDRSVERSAFVYIVTPGYLEAMGMRLIQGRDIAWTDNPDVSPALVINEAAVRREWPGRDPVGQLAPGFSKNGGQIVGVIADVRESTLEDRASVQMYLPMMQYEPEGAELVVRTRLPIGAIEPAVMAVLKSLNPGQPRTGFRAIQQIVDHAVSPRRFLMILVAVFAGFGLILASLGIYGVISYSVTRQSQEIGIRMALGATASQVQWGVVRQTMQLALVGIAAGSLASFAAAKGIASLLFGTEPADPAIFLGMVVLLALVALVAGHLPARRASRIDPMTTLRGA